MYRGKRAMFYLMPQRTQCWVCDIGLPVLPVGVNMHEEKHTAWKCFVFVLWSGRGLWSSCSLLEGVLSHIKVDR